MSLQRVSLLSNVDLANFIQRDVSQIIPSSWEFDGGIDSKGAPHISLRPFLQGGVYDSAGTTDNTVGINTAIAWCQAVGIKRLRVDGLVAYAGQVNLAGLAGLIIESSTAGWLTGPAELRYIGSAAQTTIAAGSNGATLPGAGSRVVNVASTTSYSGMSVPFVTNIDSSTGRHVVTVTAKTSTTLTVTGGSGTLSTGGSVIPVAINATVSRALVFDHLRLTYSSSAFNGYVLDLAGTVAASASFSCTDDCYIGSTNQGTIQSAIGTKVDKTHTMLFNRTYFSGLSKYIEGQVGNQSFANNILQSGCHYDGCSADGATTWGITGLGQGWAIIAPTAEANAISGNPNFVNLASGLQAADLTVIGGWLGDANGSGSWYAWAGPGPIKIIGGLYRIDNNITLLNLTGPTAGVEVRPAQVAVPAGTNCIVVNGNGFVHTDCEIHAGYVAGNIPNSQVDPGMQNALVTTSYPDGSRKVPPLNGIVASFTGAVTAASIEATTSQAPNILTVAQSQMTGTLAWANNANAVVANDSGVTISGQPTLRLRSIAAGGMNAATSAYTSISPDTEYTFLCSSLAITVGRPTYTSLFWYDGSHALISSFTSAKVTDIVGTPTAVPSIVATSPPNAAYCKLVVRVDATAAANEEHHFGLFMLATGVATSWTAPGVGGPGLTVSPASITQGSGPVALVATDGSPATSNGNVIATLADIASRAALLTIRTPTATANGALTINEANPVDATTGALTMTLPPGSPSGTLIAASKEDSTTNTVTLSGSIRGVGASTLVLRLPKESMLFLADSAGSWWPIADHKTLGSLDARYGQTVATMASLRTYTGLVDGEAINLVGYNAPGDGGGGDFRWSASSTATDDGGLVINPTGNVGAGRWARVLTSNSNVTPQMFGAKGDSSSDDTVAVQAAYNSGFPLLVTAMYRITSTITVPSGCETVGTSRVASGFQAVSDFTMLTNSAGSGIAFRNMRINNTVGGARAHYDLVFQNNYRLKLHHLDLVFAGNATGNVGVLMTKVVGQANDTNTFLPHIKGCWFNQGGLVVDGVTDGKIEGSWLWAPVTGAPGTIQFLGTTSVPSNWSIINNDIVPTRYGGIAVPSNGMTNLRVIDDFFDGSYDTVYTGPAITGTGYTRGLTVRACSFYNLSESAIVLSDVRGAKIGGNHFMQNNKADNFFPEISLTGAIGNVISDNSFSASVARTNKGLIYTEDATSSDNTITDNVVEATNFYNPTVLSIQTSTVQTNNRPTVAWPTNTLTGRVANYTVLKEDLFQRKVILCTTNPFTVTLLSAGSVHAGDPITVKNANTSASGNAITIATTSAQTIDGAAAPMLLGPAAAVTLISDGVNWQTLGVYLFSGAAQAKSGQWQGASNQAALTATALSGVSGQASWCYVDVLRTTTIAALGAHCSVALVGGTAPELRLGLFYDDGSLSYPGALVVDGGAADLTGTGTRAGSAVNVTVAPGRYWVCAKWTFAVVPATIPQLSFVSIAGIGLPGANLGNNYRGYATTGQTSGAFSGSAPAGMSASGATAVINAGIKTA